MTSSKHDYFMDQDLNALPTDHRIILKDAYAYITLLIAGADGKIEQKELDAAQKIAKIRTYAGDDHAKDFHEEVNAEMASRIQQLIDELPKDVPTRSAVISEKLEAVNPILASLDPYMGAYLYKGYVSFAQRVAKASGGILSFFSIGPEEKKWMNLPMITPVIYVSDEEE